MASGIGAQTNGLYGIHDHYTAAQASDPRTPVTAEPERAALRAPPRNPAPEEPGA